MPGGQGMPLGSGMEMQRKGCYLKLSRKKTGLICGGPGIQDDPPELPASQWLLIPPGPAPTWPVPTCLTHRCAGAPGRAPGWAIAVTLVISQAGPSPTHCFYTPKMKKAELGISGQGLKRVSLDTEGSWEGPGRSCQGRTML